MRAFPGWIACAVAMMLLIVLSTSTAADPPSTAMPTVLRNSATGRVTVRPADPHITADRSRATPDSLATVQPAIPCSSATRTPTDPQSSHTPSLRAADKFQRRSCRGQIMSWL